MENFFPHDNLSCGELLPPDHLSCGQFSPHHQIFSTGTARGARDKYEVWYHLEVLDQKADAGGGNVKVQQEKKNATAAEESTIGG